jgi:hypothetical protein
MSYHVTRLYLFTLILPSFASPNPSITCKIIILLSHSKIIASTNHHGMIHVAVPSQTILVTTRHFCMSSNGLRSPSLHPTIRPLYVPLLSSSWQSGLLSLIGRPKTRTYSRTMALPHFHPAHRKLVANLTRGVDHSWLRAMESRLKKTKFWVA